ncbi:hypothetical protein H0I76_14705 [Limibaculum sp. M0105]|uniref:Uncharacterized protein n=1 Tax=Thermohalobaculum xanthum TaxID=2753746 RepID=A0A8J7M960_9RHOB|nr:hypothetical protein [Thermohalobaculum xanthum]MBK0400448.1 hypothetical protein [Thermohalobaculum xanthum]
MIGNIVIAIGIAIALAGIAMLVRCIQRASRIRASQFEPGALEAELRRLILMNGAAVGIGFFGLAVMVVGMVV